MTIHFNKADNTSINFEHIRSNIMAVILNKHYNSKVLYSNISATEIIINMLNFILNNKLSRPHISNPKPGRQAILDLIKFPNLWQLCDTKLSPDLDIKAIRNEIDLHISLAFQSFNTHIQQTKLMMNNNNLIAKDAHEALEIVSKSIYYWINKIMLGSFSIVQAKHSIDATDLYFNLASCIECISRFIFDYYIYGQSDRNNISKSDNTSVKIAVPINKRAKSTSKIKSPSISHNIINTLSTTDASKVSSSSDGAHDQSSALAYKSDITIATNTELQNPDTLERMQYNTKPDTIEHLKSDILQLADPKYHSIVLDNDYDILNSTKPKYSSMLNKYKYAKLDDDEIRTEIDDRTIKFIAYTIGGAIFVLIVLALSLFYIHNKLYYTRSVQYRQPEATMKYKH